MRQLVIVVDVVVVTVEKFKFRLAFERLHRVQFICFKEISCLLLDFVHRSLVSHHLDQLFLATHLVVVRHAVHKRGFWLVLHVPLTVGFRVIVGFGTLRTARVPLNFVFRNVAFSKRYVNG